MNVNEEQFEEKRTYFEPDNVAQLAAILEIILLGILKKWYTNPIDIELKKQHMNFYLFLNKYANE